MFDGDWGLGIGDWGLGPIPHPHFFTYKKKIFFEMYFIINKKILNKKINH